MNRRGAGAQLPGHEADRNDAVLLGRLQKLGQRPVAGILVLEDGLVESRQRIADVRLVIDGQAPAPARVYVGKCAVRQSVARFLVERSHRRKPR